MTLHDEMFSVAAFPVLLIQHGEAVTYKPDGGSTRAITGIVTRNPPVQYTVAGNTYLPELILSVTDDATLGISQVELNEGIDLVSAKMDTGDTTARNFAVHQINSQHSGALTLALVGADAA